MAVEVIPTGAALGARVKGVDITKPISASDYQLIDAALAKYGVIFFREGPISVEQQQAMIEHFGPPNVVSVGVNTKRIKNPHFFDVSNVNDDGAIMSAEDERRVYLLANLLWHSDMSPLQPPGRVTMLHALVLPKIPPDTQFVDTRLGYEGLSDEMKERIDGLQVRHSVQASRIKVGYTDFSGWEQGEAQRTVGHGATAVLGAVHPLVRTHPGSGRKALYIGAHTDSVVGMDVEEGKALLEELCNLCTTPERIYAHKWELHDLLIWDNSITMHRAVPYDDAEKRELRWCSCRELEPV